MMHTRYSLSVALASFLITLTAYPCGPDFPEAVFVLQTGPGGNYASYAAGRIGIPQAGYRTRHMVIAYDYLSGHPLPAEVQKQAIAADAYLREGWEADYGDNKSKPGFDSWYKARAAFGPVDGYVPDSKLPTQRNAPGEEYSTFENCLDDAFATAAKTLAARIAEHGARDPAVVEWVRGQDAVFTNCGDGKASDPSANVSVEPAPRPPAAAPANVPHWLKQDRAYQLAAASFYALNYDDALARFRAVAADAGSPWSLMSRYMVARTYIRSATVPSGSQGTPADRTARQARSKDALTKAQRELVAMDSEARMAPMRAAIQGLLDYVSIRVQPEAQAAVLASRLQSPNAVTFRQAVLDLTWLHSTRGFADGPVPPLSSAAYPNDMLMWIDAVYNKDAAAALERWRSSHSTAWLVAAISYAEPGDQAAPELVKAAKSIPQADPGWLAIAYNRLRLSPEDPATRDEVRTLLPQIKRSGDVSALNLFLELSTRSAPTLNQWLATVSRVPAGESSYESGEDTPPNTIGSTDDTVRGAPPKTIEDDCGKKIPGTTLLPLFDTDGAVVFNRDMPLRVLAQAAESSALPEGLRYQVAQATWVRAVLLDRPEIAHRMTPILVACRAAWKPALAAYDSAGTPDARHATRLLALMRFPSTVPSVWEGEDRRSGFATYDDHRENWWCSTVPRPGDTVDVDPDPSGRARGRGQGADPAAVPYAGGPERGAC